MKIMMADKIREDFKRCSEECVPVCIYKINYILKLFDFMKILIDFIYIL